MESFDVLIIGAGAAGLSAARLLKRKGMRIKIIEARDRVGGRAWTIKRPGQNYWMEMGAEFIHGEKNALWDFLDEVAVAAHDVGHGFWVLKSGKLVKSDAYWENVRKVLHKLNPNQKPDRSFAEFLAHHRFGRESKIAASDYVQSFHAAEPNAIGEQYLAWAEGQGKEGAVGKSFRPTRGYESIFEVLAAEVREDILLNLVAKKIIWKRQHVELVCNERDTAQERRFSAKRVLITLPIGVLQGPSESLGALHFDPPVEKFSQVLGGLASGHILKLDLQFSTRFWEKKGSITDVGFFIAPACDFGVWWTQVPVRLPVLTAWVGGARATNLMALGLERMTVRALGDLAKIFGTSTTSLRKNLLAANFHDWSSDPFSRGAYSYVKVDGLAAQNILRRGFEDTLMFAGEALNPDGQTGTVDGAMASGIATAKRILKMP